MINLERVLKNDINEAVFNFSHSHLQHPKGFESGPKIALPLALTADVEPQHIDPVPCKNCGAAPSVLAPTLHSSAMFEYQYELEPPEPHQTNHTEPEFEPHKNDAAPMS
jgi:hypothetical protein